ncbi:hypothetical protein P7C73_g3141, partial [Tremellales sp. Uapishka_1]
MDATNISQGVKDISKRLMSMDPIEYNSAVNEYFEPNALLDHDGFYVHGATNIKKVLLLANTICTDSGVIGEPKWDKKAQTITYQYYRHLSAPHLPSYIPFGRRVEKLSVRLNKQTVLYLNAGEEPGMSDGETKYYVTKVGGEDWRVQGWPLVGYLFFHLFKPLYSLFVVSLATGISFIQRHPLKDGIFAFIFAAISESLQFTWILLQSFIGRRVAGTEKWTNNKSSELKSLVGKARTSAMETATSLQSRAKKAGVPVDEYKKTFADIKSTVDDKYQDLRKDAQPILGEVLTMADEAKDAAQPMVDDATDAAQSTIDGAKEAAQPVIDGGKEVADEAQKRAKPVVDEAKKAAKPVVDEAKKTAKPVVDQAKETAKPYVDQAKDTAKPYVDRAKETAKPYVDQAKETAKPYVDQAKETARPVVDNAATKAGEVKDQAQTVVDDTVSQADEAKHSKSKHHKKPKAKTNGNHSPSSHDSDERPTTPLGGHNPLAANAFSYASATSPGPPVGDGGPRTPLGGHDPTVDGAFSYAQATKD